MKQNLGRLVGKEKWVWKRQHNTETESCESFGELTAVFIVFPLERQWGVAVGIRGP